MKKIISLFLLLIAVFTLFSCNDEKTLVASIQDAMKYRGLAISEKVRELVNNSNKKEKQ